MNNEATSESAAGPSGVAARDRDTITRGDGGKDSLGPICGQRWRSKYDAARWKGRHMAPLPLCDTKQEATGHVEEPYTSTTQRGCRLDGEIGYNRVPARPLVRDKLRGK